MTHCQCKWREGVTSSATKEMAVPAIVFALIVPNDFVVAAAFLFGFTRQFPENWTELNTWSKTGLTSGYFDDSCRDKTS